MTGKIRDQILEIRSSGITNMFDLPMVQRLAFERGFFELTLYLEDSKEEYVHFIMYGEEEPEGNRAESEETNEI